MPFGRGEGLDGPSVASLDSIPVVARRRLAVLIGVLDGSRHREVTRGLGYALGGPELKVL